MVAFGRRLGRPFFAADAPEVAVRLLNKLLVVRRPGHAAVAGRIIEVEAYMQHDPASHTFRGQTPSNSAMFLPGGAMYVYFTYGMHHCANVVTGPAGHGQGVLLRAVLPVAGVDVMLDRRHGRAGHLADGPGKICQAFGLDRDDNGRDLCDRAGVIGIFDDGVAPPADPVASARIGIRVGLDLLWRFTV